MTRDGKQCTACRKRSNLQAHHVQPFHLNPALELDINNVVTLCGRCHLLLGHLDNWKSYNAFVENDTATVKRRIKERP